MSKNEEKNVQNANQKLNDSIDKAEEKEVIENMRTNKKNLKGLILVIGLMVVVGFAALVTLNDTVTGHKTSAPVEKTVKVAQTAQTAVK